MIPKKIKKKYLNNVDESGSNMQNREYINLNNLWHDASEEPKLGEDIIALDCDGIFVSGVYEDYVGKGIYRYHCFLCESDAITKWAYISDLLPKGGKR